MPLQATCPSCGLGSSKIPDSFAGKTVRCSKCQTRFMVPAPAPAPAATRFEEEPPRAPAATRFEDEAPAGPAPTRAEDDELRPTAGRSPQATVHEDDLDVRQAATAQHLERRPTRPATRTTAPTTTQVAVEWRPGEVVLGLYEVVGVLGQGGMGRVYRVRHRGWNVDLAVKAPLLSILEAVGGAENFEREAETWVNLGLHPHIVSCYYVRRLSGVPRVFAEFVDGGSLADAIRQRRLRTLPEILDVGIQFAWGLHFAHEHGLVHRDVKPANVMLTSEGLVKVTDFGLARARPPASPIAAPRAGGGHTLMVAGGGGGTPAYMSPEQAGGEKLTRRTDLWSFALSLLELFRGERTWEFGAAAPGVLQDHLENGPLDPALPALPGPVVELLQECFREDPEQRPHSLQDVAARLAAVYSETTGRAYPRREPVASAETADSLSNRAVSLLDLGREEEAGELWERALRSDPHHAEATYNQSLHHRHRGALSDEEALRRVDEARRAHAGSVRAIHLSGRMALAVGEYERARRALEEARAEPSPELQRDLALALLAQGHDSADAATWNKVADLVRSLLDSGHEDGTMVTGYAVALQRLGDPEKARRFFDQARAARPELPDDLAAAAAALLPGYEVMRSLKGLTAAASCLALTPDGRHAVAGSQSNTLRIWDTATGASLRTLQGETARIRVVAVTPDGRQVLWAGDDLPLQLSDLASGRALRSFQRQAGHLLGLAVTADGRHAVSGGSDRQVRLWEVASGRCVRALEGHGDGVAAVAVSADGTLALSGSLDRTVRLWDLASGSLLATLEGHQGRVLAVLFSGPQEAVSADDAGTLLQWDLRGHVPLRSFAGHGGAITALARLSDGRLASGGQDRSVRLWDLRSGLAGPLARLDSAVVALGAGPDGLLFAAAGHAVLAVDLRPERGPLAYAVARPVSALEAEERGSVYLSSLGQARERLAAGDYPAALELARQARAIPGYERSPESLALWAEVGARLPRPRLQGAWEAGVLSGHGKEATAVAAAASGRALVSASMDGSLRSWDLDTLTPAGVLLGHAGVVTSVAVSEDGLYAFTGGWDKTARLWSVVAERPVRSFEGHEDYVTAVALTPDGTQGLTASWDRTLRFWDLDQGGLIASLEGHASNLSSVACSPDGRFAISGSWDRSVRAWDLASRECVQVLLGHEAYVTAVAVAPDGRQVASAAQDGSVRLWDLKTGKSSKQLSGHAGEVGALAFSPDARHLASGGKDRTLRLWELRGGSAERVLEQPAAILGVAFAPDGSRLFAALADGTLRVTHLDWEPDARSLPEWDEKARPFLEVFLNRRRPVVLEGSLPWTEAQLDAFLGELRWRGFGWLGREPVERRLRQMTGQIERNTTYWDTVVQNRPKSVPRAPVVEEERAARPWGKLAIGAVAALLFAIGVSAWLPKALRGPVAWNDYALAIPLQEKRPDLAAFAAAEKCDDGDLEHFVAAAHEEPDRERALHPLTCLVQQGPAAAAAFVERMVTNPMNQLPVAGENEAVALLDTLGEGALDVVCLRAKDPDEGLRRISLKVLAISPSPRSTACFDDALGFSDPAVRRVAASFLPQYLSRRQPPAEQAYERIGKLAADPDPAVRAAALRCFAYFDYKNGAHGVQALAADPAPEVRTAVEETLASLTNLRKIDTLKNAGKKR